VQVEHIVMKKILWSGEHLGAYLWDGKEMGAEVSLYRVIWSPEGTGFIAFIRFSEKTKLTAMNGIYTDNKKVSDYMTSYVLKKGKPPDNIVNVISFPIHNAVCERKNNLPCSLVEEIINEDNLLGFKWHGLEGLKYYKPEKKENLSVSYSFLAGKVNVAEIYVQNKLILRTDFNSTSYGTVSTAFIGLSEIWFED